MVDEKKAPAQQQMQVRLNFATTEAVYASQFNIQATNQELFINLASSLFPGNQQGEVILPIHTRVAMNYPNAKRLLGVLQQTIIKYEEQFGVIKLDAKAELPQEQGDSNVKPTLAAMPKLES